jgi:hypothetical protein
MLQIMLVCTRTNRFARRVSCENSCQPSLAFRPVRASSNRLRQRARCTSCGGKGARIQHPGWAGTVTQRHACLVERTGREVESVSADYEWPDVLCRAGLLG